LGFGLIDPQTFSKVNFLKDIAMKLKAGITGLMLIGAAFSPTQVYSGPSGGATSGTASWSTTAYGVRYVGNNLWPSGSTLFNRFRMAGGECSGIEELMAPNTTVGLAQMQGMKSALLTAVSTGLSVRVHWVGPWCYVDDVVLCADATNCVVGY
jgi:hypothetical protein